MIVDQLQTQDLEQAAPVFRRILFATDCSPASERALCVVLPLAADNTQLVLVHVSNVDWRYEMLENPPELDLEQADAKRQFENWIARIGLERKFEKILVQERPVAQAIVATAARNGADLLVMGTHGRGGWQKLTLGSVAEEVLRLSPCPVVTVGPKANALASGQKPALHTILFATDFGRGSAKALPLVLALARRYHSKIILLHFTPPMPATSTSLSAYAPPTADNDISIFQLDPFNLFFDPFNNPDFERRCVNLTFYRNNLTLPRVITLCWRHDFRSQSSHLRTGSF